MLDIYEKELVEDRKLLTEEKKMRDIVAATGKSPKEEGFINACIKEVDSNHPDITDSGAYCAGIVDIAKKGTDWRKGPRK